MQTLLPEGWAPPVGYSNGVAVDAGRIIFVAGQVGWDAQQQFQSEQIAPQFDQALANILDVLAVAGAKGEHICRMTAYCCDKAAYMAARRELGAIWRRGRPISSDTIHDHARWRRDGLLRARAFQRDCGFRSGRGIGRYARDIEHRDIERELHNRPVIHASKEHVNDFRGFLLTALESVSRTPAMLKYAAMQKGLEQALLSSVVAAVECASDPARPTMSPTVRHTIVSRAQDYMREHEEEPLTVEDLCRVLKVSRRTLQYSFQEIMQLNPVSYLRAMRLNGVHRMLRLAGTKRQSVQDITARWGFWHLSHFAQDCRRMFGELPSETLRCSTHPARLVCETPDFFQWRC